MEKSFLCDIGDEQEKNLALFILDLIVSDLKQGDWYVMEYFPLKDFIGKDGKQYVAMTWDFVKRDARLGDAEYEAVTCLLKDRDGFVRPVALSESSGIIVCIENVDFQIYANEQLKTFGKETSSLQNRFLDYE